MKNRWKNLDLYQRRDCFCFAGYCQFCFCISVSRQRKGKMVYLSSGYERRATTRKIFITISLPYKSNETRKRKSKCVWSSTNTERIRDEKRNKYARNYREEINEIHFFPSMATDTHSKRQRKTPCFSFSSRLLPQRETC